MRPRLVLLLQAAGKDGLVNRRGLHAGHRGDLPAHPLDAEIDQHFSEIEIEEFRLHDDSGIAVRRQRSRIAARAMRALPRLCQPRIRLCRFTRLVQPWHAKCTGRLQNGPRSPRIQHRPLLPRERTKDMRSDTIKLGDARAPHRSLLRATGLRDDDFSKPFIAVCNSYTDIIPGHVHLDKVGAVRQAVRPRGGRRAVRVQHHRRGRRHRHGPRGHEVLAAQPRDHRRLRWRRCSRPTASTA